MNDTSHEQGLSDVDGTSVLEFLWLEITEKCNLQCGHCYASSGPHKSLRGHMALENWLQVLRDASRLGCRGVQFIGGEPSLHPDLGKMISFAVTEGYDFIELYTNATAMTVDLITLLARHNVRVATSFYSADSAVHDSITTRAGSFGRTVDGIQSAVAAGLHVRAGLILTAANADGVEEASAFLNELGVADVGLDGVRAIGRAGDPNGAPRERDRELCGQCGFRKLCVTSAGSVHPCVFARHVDLGHVSMGLREIVEGRPAAAFQQRLVLAHSERREDATFDNAAPRRLAMHDDVNCKPTCSPGVQFCRPTASPPSPICAPACAPSKQTQVAP
jgi:MoaA/NifB/PqqE/SkfB family radical SAM enzyme